MSELHNEILKIENITFAYKENVVLSNFSLAIEKGSFTTLLGPSGCGKTTLLRLIAGFLKPVSGKIIINGKNVTKVSVEERKIGFVFQDYALFPHMTVRDNLLFGVKGKNNDGLEEICLSLGIEKLLERYPHELSGGQQQRVALGRTLMLKPEIILMDEPLSSLDAGLRIKVREELLEIQKKIGITTVYVTHDREEALSLSTKVAVINEGKLLQYASPREVYVHPSDGVTAAFTGLANFIESEGQMQMIRPEWISFDNYRGDRPLLNGQIISSAFLGNVVRYKVSCEMAQGGIIIADIPADKPVIEDGVSVKICLNPLN